MADDRFDPIAELTSQLGALPGIGHKTAARLAYFILRADSGYAQRLADAVLDVKSRISMCAQCCNFTDRSPCRICASGKRERSRICVVESPQDVAAIEATGEYTGLYHVLHGAIAPLEGIGPDDLKFDALLSRFGDDEAAVEEVIVATNPSVEGEATALYVKRLLSALDIPVTRIASGLPMGSHLEHADKVTLGRSIADRRPL